MSTKRRPYSISLRSLLVFVTLASVGFAYFLHHRAQSVREQRRIVAATAGGKTHVNFRYSLLGFDIPSERAWLCKLAIPEPDRIVLRPEEQTPLPSEFCAIAARCTAIEYGGSEGGSDEYLRRCCSGETETLRVSRNGVTPDCLSFVGELPKLREVQVQYVDLSANSMKALLNHPSIETLDVHAHAEELSQLGPLTGESRLQQLNIDLNIPWVPRPLLHEPLRLGHIPSPGDPSPFDTSFGASGPTGPFVWLSECKQLREITMRPDDEVFLRAVGQQLGGVTRLNLEMSDSKYIPALEDWKNLRHLCLDGCDMSDAALGNVVDLLPDLHTLEIDEYSSSGVSLSPVGLRKLKQLSSLRRLRLGGCRLQLSHLEAIAELEQIEALSIEDRGVDDRTLEPLRRLPKLRQISLERTKATETPFAQIRGDWDENRPWRN